METLDWLRQLPKPGPVWEVSGGPIDECITRPLWDEGYECVVVEPNPEHYVDYANATLDRENVAFFPVAVALEPCIVRLARSKSGAAYVAGVNAPEVQKRGHPQWPDRTRRVPALPFDALDPGNIAGMILDVEGCEWWVLQRLVSEPLLLIVELSHGSYCHPDEEAILAWMASNDYQTGEVRDNGAQTVFVKKEKWDATRL